MLSVVPRVSIEIIVVVGVITHCLRSGHPAVLPHWSLF